MNPLLIAGIASGLSTVVSAGEHLLNKATGNIASRLMKPGEILGTTSTNFAEHLRAQQKGHLDQGTRTHPLSLQEYLKAESIFSLDALEAHVFHLGEHFRGHPDVTEWLDSVPTGTAIRLGYEEQGRITLLADNGQYCHLDLETSLGKEAAQLFDLKHLNEAAQNTAGASIHSLATELSQKPLGSYYSLN